MEKKKGGLLDDDDRAGKRGGRRGKGPLIKCPNAVSRDGHPLKAGAQKPPELEGLRGAAQWPSD